MSKLRVLPTPLREPAGRLASRTLNIGRGIRWVVAPDVRAAHTETSILVSSLDDVRAADTNPLIELALRVAHRAMATDLSEVAARRPEFAAMLDAWPGEHYRFLAALTAETEPAVVVELGTHRGLGTLSLLKGLPSTSRLITFDVVPWQKFPDTVLRDSDFASGNLKQRLGDLSDPRVFKTNEEIFGARNLIFMDAGKAPGVRFERCLTALLRERLQHPTMVVYDDIRLLTMVEFWRGLDLPKFDATSLAHWTGTGMVALHGWTSVS